VESPGGMDGSGCMDGVEPDRNDLTPCSPHAPFSSEQVNLNTFSADTTGVCSLFMP
jgi:hypothetical protein